MKGLAGGKESAENSDDERLVRLTTGFEIRGHGGETRIIPDSGEAIQIAPSASVVNGIVRARSWYDKVIRGEVSSFEELAKQEGVTAPYIRRVFRLASLSPNLVEKVLTGGVGNMPFATGGNGIPAEWSEQRNWSRAAPVRRSVL